MANPKVAALVPVGKNYVVYRDCGAALTKKGQAGQAAKEFVAFLASKDGAAIFKKWGWMAP